ncbi:MAG: hypothetical protein HRU08_01415 [Oleispira sp.]|nr:hypothetical protein [Oleispira sp.]
MLLNPVYLLKSILLLLIFVTNANAYDAENWMSGLDGGAKLGQLAVPGTHDSGAYDITANVGETQDWSIAEQLNNGIRFFDIRLANNNSSDDFEVRHGPLTLGSFNNLVMKSVNDFLDLHQNEVIFMSISDEDTLDKQRLESDYIYASGSKFYQGAVNGSTALNTVRGKIVLFNRYNNNTAVGIGWGSLNIQDDYNLDSECKEIPTTPWTTQRVCGPFIGLDYPKKAASVLAHFNQAANAYNNAEFWVNFTSANYYGVYIGNNADWVNPKARDYIKQSLAPVGSIIVMDYPNRTSAMIDSIIENTLNAHASGALVNPAQAAITP